METISRLTADRIEWLQEEWSKQGWARPDRYFCKCFEVQERGDMVVLVARDGEALLGYLKILWHSDYPPFRERSIPEIDDLYVTAANRRRGVATRLMGSAEAIVRARSPVVGIGVGLHPGYAAAQRMYVRRGYVPDGNPLTYRNEFVREGQEVALDEELVMHLVKDL